MGTTPIVDTIICGEAIEEMRKLPDNCINLIYTDPPYFKVKGEAWDHQWENPAKFLEWIGELCAEWQRILKPNGSLYVCASPQMNARVETKIGEYFNVLNNITWKKHDGTANEGGMFSRQCKETMRAFFPQTEHIVFAEHYGADNIAKGEAGYATKCDKLRGFIFEPIRAYLDEERKKAGIKREDCDKACGVASVASRHYFSTSQWCLPTEEHYKALQIFFNAKGSNEFLKRDYEFLKRDYDELKKEYESLRRPFQVSVDVPYTNVWEFPTVQYREGKHPCEKPIDMHRHVIAASSRPGDLVRDCFGGSCQVADACIQLGRHYIVIDSYAEYVRRARKRVLSIDQIQARRIAAYVPASLSRWAEG